ncbi:MAG: polysaccharide deacetylase family protein [Candidatus Riflebacteria bacterium]|nr:polysaccharide deacetylase family protein [Candidatus Riflebacteria bacterium]
MSNHPLKRLLKYGKSSSVKASSGLNALAARIPDFCILLVTICLLSGGIIWASPAERQTVVDPSVPPDILRDFEMLRAQYIQNPRDLPTINALGIVYARAGQLEQAVALWNEGIRINPAYVHFYNNLGSALKSSRRFDDARRVFQRGLSISPSYWIHYNLGLLEKETGHWTEAARCFQNCLAMNPGFEPAVKKLAEMGLQPTSGAVSPGSHCLPLPLSVKNDLSGIMPLAQSLHTVAPVSEQSFRDPVREPPGGDSPVGQRISGIPDDPTRSSESFGSSPGRNSTSWPNVSGFPDSPLHPYSFFNAAPASASSVADVHHAPPVAKSYDILSCVAEIQKRSNDGTPKLVALTFDDGPHATITPQILDLLKREGACATFFILGSRAEAYPDLLERMTAEGSEVGNHTWSHHSLVSQGSASGLLELNRTNELIGAITGHSSRLVRPPFGHTNARVEKMIHDQGWHQVMWDADSRDWQDGNPDHMMRRILRDFSPGAIILFHDIHPGAMRILPVLIPALKRCGYRFVTISQLIGLLQAAG